MKHAYTRRSNVNSKAQANMHTSRNNQCNPDMQCSNTWTIEISHDCKSNTESNKNWVLLEGLGEQVGFQLWLKWGVCLCVADGERQIIYLLFATVLSIRSFTYVNISTEARGNHRLLFTFVFWSWLGVSKVRDDIICQTKSIICQTKHEFTKTRFCQMYYRGKAALTSSEFRSCFSLWVIFERIVNS